MSGTFSIPGWTLPASNIVGATSGDTFVGKISQTLYGGQNVGGTRHKAKTFDLNKFKTEVPNWEQANVPEAIRRKTVPELLNTPGVSVTTQIAVTATGNQAYAQGSFPTIGMRYRYPDGTKVDSIRITNTGAACGGTGTGTYNFNEDIRPKLTGDTIPNSVNVDVFNDANCEPFGAWVDYQARNLRLIVTLIVTVELECIGGNLNAPVCQQFCTANLDDCFDEHLKYCFTDQNRIENSTCQAYFKEYLAQKGSSSTLSENLTNYCNKEFNSLEDLRNRGTSIQKDLCWCHMNVEQYRNLRESLFAAFPGFSALGSFNDRCLLSECATSNFKHSSIGRNCEVPQCLNIASFNNNGTINRSNVEIVQETKECVNLVGEPTADRDDTDTADTNDTGTDDTDTAGVNVGLIIGIVVGVLILIGIIIALIVIFTRKPESKTRAVT